ncbi:MAG: PVC-type heme-binding CxxCH protein [Planctomycetota bacterium]
MPNTRGQGDFADELPRIPPTEPSDALATFQVADGFEMQLVASEPMISTPVAIEWAADGALFVCEMRGYSEDRDAGISRITRLVDQDQDGVFDRRTIFAEGLMWPTGLMPYNGGLFVGDAPDLVYLKDNDGDGMADQKTVVLTGFGTSNVQGLMNSFRWDLDNRIHIACSSVGGKIRRPDQADTEGVNVRGRDIALDPRTGQFTLTSGAAQHGMCFDDWGRKFVSSNSDHLQQVMYEDRYVARNTYLNAPGSRISIASDGPQAEVYRISPVEPWRVVRTRLRVGGLVPGPVEGGGRAAGYFTGATGVTIYRGDAWPDQFRGCAIIGDVGSNLIHRKRLEKNGLEFIGRRVDAKSEFVNSSDIWFRPAQFANAPDGTLYAIDVCREVIEHPKSLPPDIKKHIDLTSGRDRGRIYRIAPDGFRYRATPNLADASTDSLVGYLEHENAWHRETAARRLFEKADPAAVVPLRTLVLESKSPTGRLHALYALDGLAALDEASLLKGLQDSHEHVRVAAVRLAERIPGTDELRSQLASMAKDESVHVRYQLAFTVGSISGIDAVPILSQIIRNDPSDKWIQTAVQSSAAEIAGELFAALLKDDSYRSEPASQFLSRLSTQIARQNRKPDILLAIGAIEALDQRDAAFAVPIIGRLLRSSKSRQSVIQKLSSDGSLDSALAVLNTMLNALKQTAVLEGEAVATRVKAIECLAFGTPTDVSSTLVSLIDSREPIDVQRSAIRTLGEFPADVVVEPILRQWKGFSPSLRETACDVLFARADRISQLLDAVERGELSSSDLPTPRLQIASQSKDPAIKERAVKLLDKRGSGNRQQVVADYRQALSLPGDAVKGRTVFGKNCANCHKVKDLGHDLGPNLSAMKSRGAESILVNVMDPNREVNPQYLNYAVLTADGRTLSGMITSESATSITLTRAESATDQILRRDILRLQSMGVSLMPEGLEKQIDQQAMADLIAYLLSL